MPIIALDQGSIHYESIGPETGRPVVLVHGYAMAGSLWEPLTRRLADRGLRCFAPTWPLGAHPEPMAPRADMTLPGVAAMVAAFLEKLDLHDVVLVGTDTGGLVSQLVAVHHRERLTALALTGCDAFEHFPPPILKPFMAAARTSVTFRAALATLRLAAARRRAYGALSHHDLEHLTSAWVRPANDDAGVAEDLRRLTASLDRTTSTAVAARLGEVDLPTLVAWSADDEFFPLDDGRRLAEVLPRSTLEIIEGARTFSMIDQPDRLADAVARLSGRSEHDGRRLADGG